MTDLITYADIRCCGTCRFNIHQFCENDNISAELNEDGERLMEPVALLCVCEFYEKDTRAFDDE